MHVPRVQDLRCLSFSLLLLIVLTSKIRHYTPNTKSKVLALIHWVLIDLPLPETQTPASTHMLKQYLAPGFFVSRMTCCNLIKNNIIDEFVLNACTMGKHKKEVKEGDLSFDIQIYWCKLPIHLQWIPNEPWALGGGLLVWGP